MPCPASEDEKAYYEALFLLRCVGEQCGVAIECDDPTQALCGVLREMSAEKREALVYDAHSATSRRLADWWEKHCQQDAERAAYPPPAEPGVNDGHSKRCSR